jgi:hypothetical protein
VHDDIGSEGERTLEVRRREGVVDEEDRARVMGDLRDGRDVGDPEQRVGRRLDPDDLGLARLDRRGDRGGVVHGCGGVVETPGLEDLLEQAVGAAVRVVGDHDMVAW